MHMAGHIDDWCKRNCDPNMFKDMDNVRIDCIAIPKFCYRLLLKSVNRFFHGSRNMQKLPAR